MTVRCEIIGSAKLYLADALEITGEIGRLGAVITDPPYMMGSAATRAGKGFRSRVGEWTNAAHWYAAWFGAYWGRLADDGSMWVSCNWRSMPVLTMAGDEHGAAMSSVVVWDKDWIGVGSLRGLRQRYELIAQYGRENYGIEDRSEPDIWVVPWSSQRPSGHESEKPVALLERCVGLTTGPVCDPFMGSGTTGVACAKLGRSFIGVEIEERYFDIACERIAAAWSQPALFEATA